MPDSAESLRPPLDYDHRLFCPVPAFVHSGWSDRRELISSAMHTLHVSNRRHRAFCECGSNFWIQRNRHTPDDLRVIASYCHDRFCDVCSQQRAHVIKANAIRLLEDHAHRTLDLTIRSTGEPLRLLIARLTKAFKSLRKTDLWKASVRGGAAFLEITWNPGGTGWHPHLHCILDGLWMEVRDISALWLQITVDSYIVNMKQIKDHRRAAGYIAKYSSKQFPPNIVHDPVLLREAMSTLSCRRLIIQFGSWSRFKFLHRDPNPDWETLCSSTEIHSSSDLSNPEKCRLLSMVHDLRIADPLTPPCSRSPPDLEGLYDDRPTRKLPQVQGGLFPPRDGPYSEPRMA